ncbi:MAG: hypothetical protein WAM78_15905 [Candidatus Sulfotelmatobacter sp.]
MKEVAILLSLVLMLSGCGNTNSVQAGVGGIWSAALTGGDGEASGFSFVSQFTLSGSSISFSSLQFINFNQTGNQQESCFPLSPPTSSDTGTSQLSANSAGQVTGTMTITVTSGGNVLTLTSTTVSGTINTTTNVLSNGVVTGTWAITGTTGCTGGGTFTMTQTASNV